MEHQVKIERSARYYTEGTASAATREVWFVCHGYGQLAGYFIRHFKELVNHETLVVAPEALSRFYPDSGTGRVGASWMTKEDRLQEIDDYVAYLDAVFREVKSAIGHAGFTLNVLGFSQGAATVCRWVAERKPPVTNLVCWAGFFPPDISWKDKYWQHPSFRTYVVYGSADKILTPESRKSFGDVVSSMALKPEQIVFEGGHELHAATLMRLVNQLRIQ